MTASEIERPCAEYEKAMVKVPAGALGPSCMKMAPVGLVMAHGPEPVIEMAAATKRADRVGGLHFFNPVPVMKLVEAVKTISTSDETLETLKTFGQSLGKTVVVAKDIPGFIVNLLLVPYLLDAIRALESGVATKEDIDNGMKLGCGHPMGPLTLLDFVGLDTTYYIANIMFEEFKEARYAPPPLLRRMVLAGQYGKKSGKGFYDYNQ